MNLKSRTLARLHYRLQSQEGKVSGKYASEGLIETGVFNDCTVNTRTISTTFRMKIAQKKEQKCNSIGILCAVNKTHHFLLLIYFALSQ